MSCRDLSSVEVWIQVAHRLFEHASGHAREVERKASEFERQAKGSLLFLCPIGAMGSDLAEQ